MSIFDFFRKSKPEEPKQEVLDEPSTPNIALDSSSYVNDSEVSLKKREFYTAVFLDRYSTGTPIMDDNEYPRYFQYDFEIKSPSKFHKKLVQDGYYKDAELVDILRSLRIPELKALLRELRLHVSGNKEDLINRLLATDSSDELMHILNADHIKFYSLSNKGKYFVKNHKDYIDLFNHRIKLGIGIDEYISAKKSCPNNYDFHKIIWSIFNDREFEYMKNSKFNLLTCNYRSMAEWLGDSGKQEDSLLYYLKALYFEIMASNFSSISLYNDGVYSSTRVHSDSFNEPYLTYLVGKIYNLREFYSQTIFEDACEVMNHFYEFVLCDKNTFKRLVEDIINNNYDHDKWMKEFTTNQIALALGYSEELIRLRLK